MFGQLMLGGGTYIKESDNESDLAFGFGGGYHANDEIAFEGRLMYQRVFDDEYYFATLGARYYLNKVDFFMTPSVDIHGGALLPQGTKKDIDGIFGLGAMMLYKTRWDIEFGPSIGADVVFEGPHQSVWANYTFVVRYNF